MSGPLNFYDTDLAYIHDSGFSGPVEGAAPGILGLLRAAGLSQAPVVDLGCGGAVWVRHLSAAGYQVVGIDLSPAMIALAAARVPSAQFQVGSLWSCEIPRCQAVTALGEVVCYRASQQEDCEPRSFQEHVAEMLQEAGFRVRTARGFGDIPLLPQRVGFIARKP